MENKEFKSFFKTVGGGEGDHCHYPTRLDTYGCGCAHDCSYCYAKSLLEFRKLWNPSMPSVASPARIRAKVAKLDPNGPAIRLGGMTDCFQGIEATHRVTYEAIKALNEYRIPYLIVTKSDMVASPEYLEILDKDLAHIQITVTTTDDERSLTYEKAPVPSRRIKAIETLQEAGYDVAMRLSPYIPEYIDLNVISKVNVDKVVVEFLRVNSWIKKWFQDIDYSWFTVKAGGYQHLPLNIKRELIGPISRMFPQVTVCEDEPEAYEFWNHHFNPNPDDCCNLRAR